MLTVNILRELFRRLQEWQSLYEADPRLDVLTGPDGDEYCLQDMLYLYGELDRLPRRQQQAIELFLVKNMKETDAAKMMGVSPTNPIGSYAADGLEKLIKMIERGELPRFKIERMVS